MINYILNFNKIKNKLENSIDNNLERNIDNDLGLNKKINNNLLNPTNVDIYINFKKKFIVNKEDNLLECDENYNKDIYDYFLNKYNYRLKDDIFIQINILDDQFLRHSDIIKLYPGNFLNDLIINFYIYLLEKKEILEIFDKMIFEQNNKFNINSLLIFNTYFYDYSNLESLIISKYNINYINKLTIKLEFLKLYKKSIYKIFNYYKGFDKNNIFIPINKNWHWTLIYIEDLGTAANFLINNINNKTIEEDIKIKVYYLDSLNFKKNFIFKNIIKNLITYLILAYIDLYNFKEDVTEIIYNRVFNMIEYKKIIVPKQTNGSDCGVCILEIIENIILNKNLLDEINKEICFSNTNYAKKRIFFTYLIIKLLKKFDFTDILQDFSIMLYEKFKDLII